MSIIVNNTLDQLLERNQAAIGIKNTAVPTADGNKPNENAAVTFDDVLSSLLPAGQDQIDEEKLFSALIEERLNTLKGVETATAYHQRVETLKAEMTRADGYIPVEDAARHALQDLVKDGTLSNEEAEKIHAQAFQAAQLDNNTKALYDSIGSTMAVTHVNLALQSSSEKMAMFDSGKLEAGRLSLDYTQDADVAETTGAAASGSSVSHGGFVGGGGFLFKPVSESNGNLVVLLPSSMSGDVSRVNIQDGNGTQLENGDGYGDYHDGRPIFRFNQPGRNYPDNIVVRVLLNDGSSKEYNIPNPSQRYE